MTVYKALVHIIYDNCFLTFYWIFFCFIINCCPCFSVGSQVENYPKIMDDIDQLLEEADKLYSDKLNTKLGKSDKSVPSAKKNILDDQVTR